MLPESAPGHIGTCVCPGEGCQRFVSALRRPNANTPHRATKKYFSTALGKIGLFAKLQNPEALGSMKGAGQHRIPGKKQLICIIASVQIDPPAASLRRD